MSAAAKPADESRGFLREVEAARVTREQIAALAEGDPEFIRDTLEGEIDFEGLVGRLVASIGEDEAQAGGLDEYIKALGERRRGIENRAEHKRALVLAALQIADRPSLRTATGTISLRPVPPKLIKGEEADIPAEFWKPQPPKVDAKALLDALKEGRVIPGASLSNGGQTISIRRA